MTTQNLDALAAPGLLRPHLQCRAQRSGEWGAILVPYIDARGAATILDAALGVGGWGFAFHTPPTARQNGKGFGAIGRLTLYVDLPNGANRAVVHEDIGAGGDDSMETGAKGSASDCLKRCAVQAGVGRFLGRLGEAFVSPSQCKQDKRGKYVPKPEAMAEALDKWRETLGQWADAWATKGQDGLPDTPAEGDGHDAEDKPGVPEGHEVDPDTGEVTPTKAQRDANNRQVAAGQGGENIPDPAADEAAANAAWDASDPGATDPLTLTGWKDRADWAVAEYGAVPVKAAVCAVMGVEPDKAAEAAGRLDDNQVWREVLEHVKRATKAPIRKEQVV